MGLKTNSPEYELIACLKENHNYRDIFGCLATIYIKIYTEKVFKKCIKKYSTYVAQTASDDEATPKAKSQFRWML